MIQVPKLRRAAVFRAANDSPTRHSRDWAAIVIQELATRGIQVDDYEDGRATPENFYDSVQNFDPLAVFIFGHGSQCDLYGEHDRRVASLLGPHNIDTVSGRAVASVACLSASVLGLEAIEHNCIAYDGYDGPFEFFSVAPYHSGFRECAIEVFVSLAAGKTFQEAHDEALAKEQDYISRWRSRPPDRTAPFAISSMFHNSDRHKLLGNGSAKIL